MSVRTKPYRAGPGASHPIKMPFARRVVVLGTGAFLGLCLLAGGASRIHDLPLILIRPLAVLLIGLIAGTTPGRSFARYRWLLALLALFAATMAAQLVPLPPGLWAALPLSGLYADASAVVGLGRIWRPLSIAPDLTVNGLLALLPPLAAQLGVATLGRRGHGHLLTCLLGGVAFSALLGLAQFAGGANSVLYLWAARSEAVADGVFANRNHQATFIACGLALLGAWISAPSNGRSGRNAFVRRLGIGAAMAVLFMVAVVATGSRTGMVLALAALAYSYWTVLRSSALAASSDAISRPVWQTVRWSWLAIPPLLAVVALAGRAVTFQRLMGTNATEDQRVSSLPTMLAMLRRTFPFGSGYGSFDPLFRTFEPDAILRWSYFNHAHDDFLELLITGGLPAALVIVLGVGWWAWTMLRLLRAASSGWESALGRSAGFAMLLTGAASLVDYPARTPLIACLLAILCVWLVDGMHDQVAARARKGERGKD